MIDRLVKLDVFTPDYIIMHEMHLPENLLERMFQEIRELKPYADEYKVKK